jgi:hypothetical protein
MLFDLTQKQEQIEKGRLMTIEFALFEIEGTDIG